MVEREEQFSTSGRKIVSLEECLTLPKISQEGIRKALMRIENCHWLQLRTPKELEKIVPRIEKTAYLGLKALRTFANTADVDCDSVVKEIGDMIWSEDHEPRRVEAVHTIFGNVYPSVTNRIIEAFLRRPELLAGRDPQDILLLIESTGVHVANHLSDFASWEIFKDQFKIQVNPLSFMMSFYEIGAVGVNFKYLDLNEK